MKKVAIVTLPLHTNYGGILQAYALQTVLQESDCRVQVICKNEKPYISWKKEIVKFYRRYVLGRKNVQLASRTGYRESLRVRKYTDRFIKERVSRRMIYDFRELKEKEYDCIVVGSDQVWRPRYFCAWYGEIYDAFLEFAKDWNVQRIAYAASFGVSEWEYDNEQTHRCSQLLKLFDTVSVREESGVELCKKNLGRKDTVLVIDPTMLLPKDHYLKLADTVPPYKGKLMCYILDMNPLAKKFIGAVSETYDVTPFYTGSKVEDPKAKLEERIQPAVEKWLAGFRDAEYVLTDSFHACVFAIIFNKPFIVIGNTDRGNSRFDSLLSVFGLQNRFITSVDGLRNVTDINWDDVNTKVCQLRQRSMRFLKGALKND